MKAIDIIEDQRQRNDRNEETHVGRAVKRT
jgi:hypothetical protein